MGNGTPSPAACGSMFASIAIIPIMPFLSFLGMMQKAAIGTTLNQASCEDAPAVLWT